MLHIDSKVGSLKPGKDADVVVWSAHPLSIYAKAEKTFVDGIMYWDIDRDAQVQKAQTIEKARIIQKLLASKSAGSRIRNVPLDKQHHHFIIANRKKIIGLK